MNKSPVRFSILILLFLLSSYKGYSQSSQYEPTLFEGSTVVEQIYSPGLEGNLLGDNPTRPVKVYLPPGYDNFPKNEYPVVYLFGGFTWDYNTYYRSHNMLERLNKAISQKIIPPMILVTPDGFNKYHGCGFANSYVTGNWEDFITQDVIPGIESRYRIRNQPQSRGLSGFSGGGYGTARIGMKHASLFNSISIMAGAKLDFEKWLADPTFKENVITALTINKFRANDPWQIRATIASAAAYAPDSTALPLLGRFPYNIDGEFVDSIWQKWLLHDPIALLDTYKDSLLILEALQMYIGADDAYHIVGHESFHQALTNFGIEHGYEVFQGDHTPGPVIDKTLNFFAEHLAVVVPTIQLSGEFRLDKTSTLKAESDMDGKISIVPLSAGYHFDSILKYQIASLNVLAHEEAEIQLSEYDFGKYHVFAVSNDGMVSNIHSEFLLVPDASPPELILENDTVTLGDSIFVKSDKDGTIYMVTSGTTPDKIGDPVPPKYILTVKADTWGGIPTDSGMYAVDYKLFAEEDYGLFSEACRVNLVDPEDPVGNGISRTTATGIKIFPNPVNGLLTIQTKGVGVYFIEISSLNGKQIYSETMEGISNQIDLSSFQKGVYFITIKSKDFVTTRKVIKL
jgi:S-formylglutathione hydrolase FrmB